MKGFAAVLSQALKYRRGHRSVTGCGPASFDLVQHGGCSDPAGIASLSFALPRLTHSSSYSLQLASIRAAPGLTFRSPL